MSPEAEYVEVQLELGHEADPFHRNLPEGFTHQWTLFVRGPDHCKIEEFVDKVVFNLHPTFPKPRRSFREPPFSIREFGYAGFELAIDIFFKNKEEPKKITYNYDLFLSNTESVHNTRREKLTFQNPSPHFKQLLLRAGGKCYPEAKDKSHPVAVKHKAKSVDRSPPASNPTASPRRNNSHNKPSGHKTAPVTGRQRIPQKDIPTHSAVTASATKAVSREKPAVIPKSNVLKGGDTFTDLFGPPLPTRPSPDPVKQKDMIRKIKSENDVKVKQEPKETGNSGKALPTDGTSAKSGHQSSPSHRSKGDKSSSKRSSSSSSSKKKRKRERRDSSSSSSSHDSDTAVPNDSSRKCDSKLKSKAESGEDRRTKVKGKDIRSVASGATGASTSSQKSKDVKKENFTSTTISFSNNNNTGTTTLEIKSVKKEKTWDSESKKSKSREFSNEESETVSGAANSSSNNNNKPGQERASSSSPTSVASDANGPQTGNGSRDDGSSPLSSASTSRNAKKCESGSDSDTATRSDKKWKCDASSDGDESADRQKYLTELLWIQKRINETSDPYLLQQVVDLIELSKCDYELTDSSFNFNILHLDKETLCKLRQIVEKG